jgi:hypothetical protein
MAVVEDPTRERRLPDYRGIPARDFAEDSIKPSLDLPPD